MTNKGTARMPVVTLSREQWKAAICAAINQVGLDAFKRTSMFLRNDVAVKGKP
jgi:hypothetical protein